MRLCAVIQDRFVRAIGGQCGQGTVEAALLIPVICIGVLLLVQPAIVLYDRMVMANAASETCRVVMTLSAGEAQSGGQAFALRRLRSIPQHDCFHLYSDSCSYEVNCFGGEASSEVSVVISNRLKPLPLIGTAAGFLGLLDGDGCLRIQVEASMPTQPAWVFASPAGSNPAGWPGAWLP